MKNGKKSIGTGLSFDVCLLFVEKVLNCKNILFNILKNVLLWLNRPGQAANLPLMVRQPEQLPLGWARQTPIKGGVHFKFIYHQKRRNNLSSWERSWQTGFIFFSGVQLEFPPLFSVWLRRLASEKIACSGPHPVGPPLWNWTCSPALLP